MKPGGKVLALAGGVGGAKLALGLSRVLSPEQLVICVNTGDDDCFHGLHVSPDLDTVMYTLAGLSDPDSGWGLAGDTFGGLEMLGRYGAETWFNLGDRDLATHIRRTQLLQQGATLSEVTDHLARRLGAAHRIVPMSDDPVRTVLDTDQGKQSMQEYFVQRRAEPAVVRIGYEGAQEARVSPGVAEALDDASLIVLCPSNPYLSIGPILAVSGMRERLEGASARRVAVSPIVGGEAVKGPTAKIMAELGSEVSCVGAARQYRGICDTFVIDKVDAHLGPAIERLGMKPAATSIIMNTDEDKAALARVILEMGEG